MRAVTSIMRVQQILMARLNTLLKPFDLTFPRYEALMLLYYSRRGSLPLGKIGGRLQVHPTSVTNLIDGLERTGLVRREPHDARPAHDAGGDHGLRTGGRRAATRVLNEARFGTAPLEGEELDAVWDILRALRANEGDFTLPRACYQVASRPPVYRQRHSRHVVRCARRQEDDGALEIVSPSQPAERDPPRERLLQRSSNTSDMSVGNQPGAIAFTQIRCRAHLTARSTVSAPSLPCSRCTGASPSAPGRARGTLRSTRG